MELKDIGWRWEGVGTSNVIFVIGQLQSSESHSYYSRHSAGCQKYHVSSIESKI